MLGICMLSYQVYHELNKLSNVYLIPMFSESGDDVGNILLQLISSSLIPSQNNGNASNQKTSAANQ